MIAQSHDAARDDARPRVAVIGAGVSGLSAAYALRRTHQVTLFEANDRLGGHAHTHQVRLFRELGVPTRPTEMSMSISCAGCGLRYAGGRGPRGLLGGLGSPPARGARQAARLAPVLGQVPGFYRAARGLLATPRSSWDPTLAEFLGAHRFSTHFVRHFVVPLVSCVWSSGDLDVDTYPARHLFTFLDHHGMLQVRGSATWRTVVGGSRSYVDRLAGALPDLRAGSPVRALARHEDTVEVTTADGTRTSFEEAVVATHADQALALLADADPTEKEALAAFSYSVNPTVLHTDASLLPPRRARASCNYAMSHCHAPAGAARVTYWMNRLHGLEPSVEDLLVTLAGPVEVGAGAQQSLSQPGGDRCAPLVRDALGRPARRRIGGAGGGQDRRCRLRGGVSRLTQPHHLPDTPLVLRAVEAIATGRAHRADQLITPLPHAEGVHAGAGPGRQVADPQRGSRPAHAGTVLPGAP